MEDWIINYQWSEKYPGFTEIESRSSPWHRDALYLLSQTQTSASRHNSPVFCWHSHPILHFSRLPFPEVEMVDEKYIPTISHAVSIVKINYFSFLDGWNAKLDEYADNKQVEFCLSAGFRLGLAQLGISISTSRRRPRLDFWTLDIFPLIRS